MIKYLKKFINNTFSKPGIALDLGCGDGRDIKALNKLGWEATGVDRPEVDLNKPYKSNKEYDLVFSNYVFMFIKNKKTFVNSVYNNLKSGGWVFIHTMSEEDKFFKNCGVNLLTITKQFNKKFNNIKICSLKIWDDEPKHKHWHQVIELHAQRRIFCF